MPFIKGRFYMNPQYGAAIERARRSDGDLLSAIMESIEKGSVEPILHGINAGRRIFSFESTGAATDHSGACERFTGRAL